MTFDRLPSLVRRRADALLLLTAALLLPLGAQAQPTTAPPDSPTELSAGDAPRTAYLVRSAEMLPVVLKSARTSLTGEADVVVVEPAVKGLVHDSKHAEALTKSLDAGVRVVACGLAMEKTGVAPSDLLDGIDTAENGFYELFRLQDEGYETVQLQGSRQPLFSHPSSSDVDALVGVLAAYALLELGAPTRQDDALPFYSLGLVVIALVYVLFAGLAGRSSTIVAERAIAAVFVGVAIIVARGACERQVS